MTLSEAAAALGVAAVTLRAQVKNGSLRAEKVGHQWVVTPAELDRYARDHLGKRKKGAKSEPKRKAGDASLTRRSPTTPNSSARRQKKPRP